MKKISLVVTFFITSIFGVNAQGETAFGLSGGFINGSANVSIAGFDLGNTIDDLKVTDGSGFYIGLLAELSVSEKFSIQPEALYTNVGGESLIMIPVMAKYYIADKFNIQAGPQLDFLLDVPAVVDEVIKKSGFSLGFGAGYDINDSFAVQAKYTVGLNNRVDGNLSDLLDDSGLLGSLVNPEIKTNALLLGLVYKFQ